MPEIHDYIHWSKIHFNTSLLIGTGSFFVFVLGLNDLFLTILMSTNKKKQWVFSCVKSVFMKRFGNTVSLVNHEKKR